MEPLRYHHLSKVKENATKSRRSVVCRVVERVSIVADGAPLSESLLRIRKSCRHRRGGVVCRGLVLSWGVAPERSRAISTARLCVLPHLHLRPIDVIVSDGPIWRSYLEGGFVLRCFQHLS